MKLYHGTNFNSAVNIVNNGIDLAYSKQYLDFGPGFYATPSYEHAAKCAIRATEKCNAKNKNGIYEEPYIVELNLFTLRKEGVNIRSFPRHCEQWGKFVLNNRLTKEILDEYNIVEHNQDVKYDICYGEMADGSVVNIAYQVNKKIIMPDEVDFKDFLKDNGKVYPAQYSFHTLKAISCIKVLSCDIIKNKSKYLKTVGRR